MEQTFENIITGDVLKDSLLDALEQISSILVHHSGPFASNCVIGSKYRQINEVDEITKDGINILKHVLVSEDPGARFAARLARFVGIAVDSRCHDGTTTSMLMFCALAKIAVDKMDTDYLVGERYEWSNEVRDVLDQCLTHLEKLKVTDDDILARCKELGIDTSAEQVRGAIAYHMAMISSKGDKDLSAKIASIIQSSPKKIYGMYRNLPSAVETKEAYILKRQEYDLGVRANLGNMGDFNYKNDTQYLSNDAVIFATRDELSMHSMESMFLQAFIADKSKARLRANLAMFGVEKGWDEYHEGKRNLIILAPGFGDPGLIETINFFNYDNPSIKISWFTIQVDHKIRTSFNNTLHFMSGTPLFEQVMTSDATQCLIGLPKSDEETPLPAVTPIRVHLLGSHLTISHLYQRDGETFHPFYRDPEAFKPYTDFRLETEEIIQFAQDNISNPTLDQQEFNYLTSLYRSLTSQEIYDIEVGGSKHDQLANMTVYEDAIGAALSAVDEGVILGGYGHLATYFGTSSKTIHQRFAEAFVGIVTDSLRISQGDEIDPLFEDTSIDKWSYIVADRASYRNGARASDYVKQLRLTKIGMEAFLDRRDDYPVLLQAYAGYQEQFKRFRDILPKISNTSHLVDMRSQQDVGGI